MLGDDSTSREGSCASTDIGSPRIASYPEPNNRIVTGFHPFAKLEGRVPTQRLGTGLSQTSHSNHNMSSRFPLRRESVDFGTQRQRSMGGHGLKVDRDWSTVRRSQQDTRPI
jgi:hypothetical protein